MAPDTATPTVVAIVTDPATNTKFDECWTWEAGQNYAQGGYLVEATAPDGHMSVVEAQSLYDYERRLFIDCWDRTEPFDHG